MVKLDEILEAVKYKEAAKKKEEKKTCILWILAIIGIVAAVAAVAYAVYRYLTPDYLEDFDDDFDADGGTPGIGEKPLTYDGSNKDGNV